MLIKMESRISLEELLLRIESTDHDEIDAIIDALQSCCKRLFPDWEVVFLSMPTGNPENRREQGKLLIAFIQNYFLETH